MPRRPPIRLPTLPALRGAAQLATQATAGLTDLVEAMHARIARLPGTGAGSAADGRTTGVTGLVYRSIHGVTRLAGGSVDALLGLLAPALQGDTAAIDSPARDAVLAALNGVLGDHLAATANPLATTMAWRHDGRPLALEPAAIRARLPGANGRLLLLLHGLCMNDRQWLRDGHDHGAALARELGFTPVYLHYNSGLHVSDNGLALSLQLERLLAAWPCRLQRVVLLTHSMGGLLARSALHQGRQAAQRWPQQVSDLVFLGTPHHGAPLERAGHWIDILLSATPYAAPLARLARVRSAGITDLRHGNLLDEDWQGRGGGADARHDHRRPVPLPDHVRCFAVAATTGQHAGDLKDRLLGDGLVPVASALGQHADPARALAFAPQRQWLGHGINHMQLLSHPAVLAQLRQWLA